MALLWVEGFETFGTSNTAVTQQLIRKYGVPLNVTGYCILQDGRHFGKSLRIQNLPTPQEFSIPPFTPVATIVIGAAIKVSYNSFGYDLIRFYEDETTYHIAFQITESGSIKMNRAGVTLAGASVPNVIMVNQWYYIEIKVHIHDTLGFYEVRVNNTVVATASGLNTRNGGVGEIDRVNFRGWSAGGAYFVFYDDMYILDTTGTVNNDFLGSQIVEAVYPNNDVSVSWLPSNGSVNADLVDENPANDDVDYVSSASAGNKDLYSVEGLSQITGDIKGLQVNVDARVTELPNQNLRVFLKSNGTETHAGVSQSVEDTAYRTFTVVSEKNPSSNDLWTPTEVDAAECGIEHIT